MIIRLATPNDVWDGCFKAAPAATQKFAFMGRSGSGKTYAAGVLIEGLLSAKVQTVIVDPVGVHYALRVAAGGASPSLFSIPVFGGEHADVPVLPSSGALIASLIVERNLSAVIDISDFRAGEQHTFMSAFADELFQLKKRSRSPLHLVLEEAHEFAPQFVQKGEERMLGNVERLARLGRNYGLGFTLISQSPQSVSKRVLNQTECLVSLQMNGSHERKAIAAWAKEKGADDLDLIATLPKLAVGEAIVWSPQWLRVCARCRISPKRTYDASSTPTAAGKVAEPRPLDGADLERLKEAMSAVEQETAQNDPKKLRARIAELEKKAAPSDFEARLKKVGDDLVTESRAKVAALDELERLRALLRETQGRLEGLIGNAHADVEHMRKYMDEIGLALAARPSGGFPVKKRTSAVDEQQPRTFDDVITETVRSSGLKRGARAMLEMLARRNCALTKTQLATLCGFSPSSGTYASYVSALRQAGYVVDCARGHSAALIITDAGQNLFRGTTFTDVDVKALWMARLKRGARAMLENVIANPGVTRSQLADRVGMEPKSGTYASYLSTLRHNGLIREQAGALYAAEELL